MWKRLRPGRKNEPDKPASPPTTPTKSGPPGTGGSGTASEGPGTGTEGFLCPMCMKVFQNPEDLQQHFELTHDDTAQPPEKESSKQQPAGRIVNQGFICPQCKEGHVTAEALQAHFMKAHELGGLEISANRDGDVLALRQEIDDLRTTLKEEKWYSSELRKEMEKLQTSPRGSSDSAGLTDEEKVELEFHRQQLKASEESRVLLSSEVVHLRDKLDDAKTASERLQEAKTMIEQKAAKLSGDIVAAKARADEVEGQRVGFENHIKTLTEQLAERNRYTQSLESQLAQRPGADDVLVLRQELVHAQTLMDQITQDQEREKKTVEEEYAALKAEHQRANEKIKELEKRIADMPNVEELEVLKASLSASSSESGELLSKISEKETMIKEKDKQCMQLKDALQEQVSLLQTKEVLIQEIQKNLVEKEKAISEKKEELKKLDEQLVALKEDSARFEERSRLMDGQSTERAEMIEKIQLERSSVETANRSLETEKLRVEKDLEAAKLVISQKESEIAELFGNRTELQQQIEKKDNKLSEREREVEGLHNKVAEARQAIQAATYEKEQQNTNMKIELEKAENKLKERESSLKDMDKQLTVLTEKHQVEMGKTEETKVQLREKETSLDEERRKVEYRDSKVKELEGQVVNIKESVSRLESERTDLLAKIEAGDGVATAINQLTVEKTSLQERLTASEAMIQKQAAEYQEKVDGLHKQIQDSKTQIKALQETKDKLDENVKAVQEKLEESKVRVTALEGELKTKGEVLLATETAKETQRADLENHIKTIQNSLDEKVNELDKTKVHLEQIKQELSEQKEKSTKLEGTIKEQTAQTNQLQQQIVTLEADVKGRDAGLERAESTRAALQTDLEGKLQSLQGQLQDVRSNLEKTMAQLRESQAECKKLTNELNDKTEALKTVTGGKNKLEADLNKKIEEMKMMEQSKRATESQLLVAQDTINEKAYQLEKTQSALETEVAKLKNQYTKACESATAIQKQLKEQIESLESSRNQVVEEKSKLDQQLVQTKSNLAASNKLVEETQTKLKQEQVNNEDAAHSHSGKIQDMDEKITSLQHQLTTEKNAVAEQLESIGTLQDKIKEFEAIKEDLEKKLQEADKNIASKEGLVKESEEAMTKYKQEETLKEEGLKKQLDDAAKTEQTLTDQLKRMGDKATQLEKDLAAHKEKVVDLEKSHTAVSADFSVKMKAFQDTESENQKQMSSLLGDKASLTSKLESTEKSLQEIKAKRDELKENKSTLEQTLIDQQKLYKDVVETKASLEKELNLTKTNAEKQLQEKTREITEHTEAREVLIRQKLELQNQVTNLGTALSSLRSEYDESKEAATQLEDELRTENTGLKSQTNQLEKERKNLEQQKEEMKVQHEMQVLALSDNLSVVRSELVTAQTRLEETEKTCNEIKGERLELEAKLGNNNDERRALLERCLASEAEVQKLQEKVTEVRRKLDDTQAALHELGRENQSLQIISTKNQGRKWTDDSQVNNCLSCNKGFSMTVRKHHCRNCGNIYCNECSAKTAAVAASKKPVRVCDTCYSELQAR